MQITIEDILPMNKGTQAYTEYSFDERVLNHMMDTPGADDWKMGHIHSHNTMNVFFSGTDWSELEDNAPNHNIYLSLIVNNFMDFCAKVAFTIDSGETTYTAKDEDGVRYEYSVQSEASTKLVTYDCNISSPASRIVVEQDFADKVEGIIKDAEAKTRPVINSRVPAHTTRITTTRQTQSMLGKLNQGSKWVNGSYDSEEEDEFWQEALYGRHPLLVEIEEEAEEEFMTGFPEEDPEEDEEMQIMEDFGMFVMNIGQDHSVYKDIFGILEFYRSYNPTPLSLAAKIIEAYVPAYNTFFVPVKDAKEKVDMYIDVTVGLIEHYENCKYISNVKYERDVLTAVIAALTSMLEKYKNYESVTT